MGSISTRQITGIVIFVLLLAAGSQVFLRPLPGPDYPVPATACLIAAMLAGVLLPRPLGTWAYLIYLILGIVSIPLFPGFQSGMEVLKADGGGYLFGGLLGVILVSLLSGNRDKLNFWSILAAVLVGTTAAMAVAFGRVWLGHGMDRALSWTFFPQIPVWGIIVFSSALLAWLVRKVWKNAY